MKKKCQLLMEGIFLLVLISQVGGVIFFNLSDTRCSLDTDWANTIYHFAEIIKNGTLQLQDWYYTTSMELDGAFLFGLPLYYITKDLFLAVGISNIIMMFLYIGVVGLLLYREQVDRIFIYLTLTLIITPYSYGMTEYFNMMFYGGGCYAVKVLVPLLFLLLLSDISRKIYETRLGKVELSIVGILYVFFLFMTAFSTGFYSVLCGILPIIIWMMVEIFIEGRFQGRDYGLHGVLVIVTVITFLLGQSMHEKLYGLPSRTNMRLTKIENYAENFRACFAGIFKLFGAATSDDIEALSVPGIILCVKMLFVTVLLVSLVFVYIKHRFSGTKIVLKNFLAFIFVWNFLILLLADTRYSGNLHMSHRYHLIGAVPMIILFGIQLSQLSYLFNEFQKGVAEVIILAFAGILLFGNINRVVEKWDRSTYAVEVCEYVDSLGVESAIFVDDKETGQFCKGLDNDHKYGIYLSDSQSLHLSIDSYYESQNASYYGDSHALFVIQGNNLYDLIPAEIADKYEAIGTCKWFDVYFGEELLLVP